MPAVPVLQFLFYPDTLVQSYFLYVDDKKQNLLLQLEGS